MGLKQLETEINWSRENIAPEGQPPYYIDVGVIPKSTQNKMPQSSKTFMQKTWFETVRDDIKSALQIGN